MKTSSERLIAAKAEAISAQMEYLQLLKHLHRGGCVESRATIRRARLRADTAAATLDLALSEFGAD